MRPLPTLLALAMLVALPATAAAQQLAPRPAVPRALVGAALIYPLTLTTRTNLDFGLVASTGAGTVVIDPNTSRLSTTGLVTSLGGNPRPATFVGASRSASVVIIRIPKAPITIRRAGGTETMVVRDFTLQGQDKRTLARMEAFDFKVGATLVVAAGQVEGVYSGEFDVTVQYP
nr:DUF4402 domain-containing protein [uncultured Sphingomonas sp.]